MLLLGHENFHESPIFAEYRYPNKVKLTFFNKQILYARCKIGIAPDRVAQHIRSRKVTIAAHQESTCTSWQVECNAYRESHQKRIGWTDKQCIKMLHVKQTNSVVADTRKKSSINFYCIETLLGTPCDTPKKINLACRSGMLGHRPRVDRKFRGLDKSHWNHLEHNPSSEHVVSHRGPSITISN